MKPNPFKRHRFPREIIVYSVYLKLRFALSYRDIKELMQHRQIFVSHTTLNRWVLKFAPILNKEFRKVKKFVGKSWRLDETYLKVKGKWRYLYRAVDKQGNTIDFMLTKHRDKKAAKRFFQKSVKHNGIPLKVNIDGSKANAAGLREFNKEQMTGVDVRNCKYLNNIVESDHRFIKKITRPMLGFKSFRSAAKTIAGIETVNMIRKGQSKTQDRYVRNPFDIFKQLLLKNSA